MSETYAADTWLYGKLHTDVTLMAAVTGVYADMAPESAAYPLVIFALLDGDDLITINGIRIWVTATYEVKVITDAESFSGIKAAVDRIDALLHRASGTVTDGTVYECVRTMPLRYVEQLAGRQYLHLGGLYRLRVQ